MGEQGQAVQREGVFQTLLTVLFHPCKCKETQGMVDLLLHRLSEMRERAQVAGRNSGAALYCSAWQKEAQGLNFSGSFAWM